MRHDRWKEDMHDGVDTLRERMPHLIGVNRLHKSIDATPDPERMKDDTIFRTGGVCGG